MQYFGELGLLHDAPRAATVQAVGELTCLQLDEAGFRKVVDALLPAFATRRELYSHAT